MDHVHSKYTANWPFSFFFLFMFHFEKRYWFSFVFCVLIYPSWDFKKSLLPIIFCKFRTEHSSQFSSDDFLACYTFKQEVKKINKKYSELRFSDVSTNHPLCPSNLDTLFYNHPMETHATQFIVQFMGVRPATNPKWLEKHIVSRR